MGEEPEPMNVEPHWSGIFRVAINIAKGPVMSYRRLWALCLPFLLVGCIDFGGSRENDKVEVIQEEKSPNGQYVATSFSCSGGGAAGYFYFNANLRKAGEELDQLDVLMGKHKDWKAFAAIEVRWIDNQNLEVSYSQNESPAYKENNAVKVESKYGIKIHHLIKKAKAMRPPMLLPLIQKTVPIP